ncbi:DUF1835 domain-containing protein [Lysinibacillus halotolerans]|uniref:DUF1835 domain-containing protein n=1 Tax=Lysinibacillus halotolerans TaxID=1368476 RepID=A0A3M8H7G8_9BACI|nr:DUF1835 domain-containing protein [Lysinibacillus halotolerans]RNC98030.1 DUF1835 domain-containing protein [Lysinibacillus halotolerans]
MAIIRFQLIQNDWSDGQVAEERNIHMQNMEHLIALENRNGVVHICTSEEVAGALRFALQSPKIVIGFPDSFSVGPLWSLNDKIGQNFRKQWLFDCFINEEKEIDYEKNFTNTLCQINSIPKHVPIYIWYSNNVGEQTGLRYYLYLMREKQNKVFLLNCSELNDNPKQTFHYTDRLDSIVLKDIFEKSKEIEALCDEQHYQLQREWEKLSETKEVLRIWINNGIQSVPENYYDLLIIETIEKLHQQQRVKDYILCGILVGEILSKMVETADGTMDDRFLEYRIRQLINNGVFESNGDPKSMRHYSVKMR